MASPLSMWLHADLLPQVTPTDDNTWLGAPNTTALNSNTPPNWSSLTFSAPTDSSSDHDVGFTSGFVFVESSTGGMESMWYATPSSVDGIYSLKWNESGDATEGKVVLALTKTPPSSAGKTKARAIPLVTLRI
ncbi:hypothetical protein CSHISOI_05337 [Colletotrichum shisoi]|uniref:Uncharacterized protein n=1 Tax=Colletotrichum shisoi TaxID=2078593 RepID=A0A5Q4BT29_9PEZI|nr:hypothetical protein CSHISOI_05337 [Colletotrichum shisoi]